MLVRTPPQICGVAQLPQYSEKDWCYANTQKYGNADRRCSLARVLIKEINRSCDELQRKTVRDSQHVTRTYEERTKDIQYWRSEADNRVGRLLECTNRLLEFKDRLRNALAHYSPLLTTISQCLLVRMDRQGVDQVDDRPQQMLQKSFSYFKQLIKVLEKTLAEVLEQIRANRATWFRLNQDLNDKHTALDIDMITENMSPPKPPPELQPGLCPEPKSVIVDEWLGFCMHNITKAENKETKSQNMYIRVEEALNESYRDFEKHHKMIIEALEDRINQTRKAKIALEERLAKTVKEIENITEPIQRLQEDIDSKISILCLSQIKLNARRYRPHAELCRDKVELELEKEIIHTDDSVQQLQTRLKWAQKMLQSLQSIRLTLEEDIRVKTHTIFLDEIKCLPLMNCELSSSMEKSEMQQFLYEFKLEHNVAMATQNINQVMA